VHAVDERDAEAETFPLLGIAPILVLDVKRNGGIATDGLEKRPAQRLMGKQSLEDRCLDERPGIFFDTGRIGHSPVIIGGVIPAACAASEQWAVGVVRIVELGRFA